MSWRKRDWRRGIGRDAELSKGCTQVKKEDEEEAADEWLIT